MAVAKRSASGEAIFTRADTPLRVRRRKRTRAAKTPMLIPAARRQLRRCRCLCACAANARRRRSNTNYLASQWRKSGVCCAWQSAEAARCIMARRRQQVAAGGRAAALILLLRQRPRHHPPAAPVRATRGQAKALPCTQRAMLAGDVMRAVTTRRSASAMAMPLRFLCTCCRHDAEQAPYQSNNDAPPARWRRPESQAECEKVLYALFFPPRRRGACAA